MVKGSCVCSKLQYEFTLQGDPINYVACHCLPCRKTSGADRSINLIIPDDTIKITSGSLKTVPRSGDSGKTVRYHQCENCSNIIFVRSEAMAGATILKVGTIDDSQYVDKLGLPKAEIYCKNNWSWEQPIQGAAQIQGAPPS